MLVVVDTSVWVEAFRRRGRDDVRSALRVMLDEDRAVLAAPSRIELLSGSTHAKLEILRRSLGAVPTWTPGQATWSTVEGWLETTTRRGERFGVVDLLIGAVAAEHHAPIWSLDQDFERLAKLGLVTIHEP